LNEEEEIYFYLYYLEPMHEIGKHLAMRSLGEKSDLGNGRALTIKKNHSSEWTI
jgi:hypothetical protein